MMRTRRFVLLVLASVGAVVYTTARSLREAHASTPYVYEFAGVHGPNGATVVAKPVAPDWRRYEHPGGARLAILLTDTASPWIGLARGLGTIGIPFTITRDWREAVSHHVVWVYPRITGSELPPEAYRAIGAIPRNGGTLIASEVVGGGLNEVFGFTDAQPSRARRSLRMTGLAIGRFDLSDPAEQILRLGRPLVGAASIPAALGSYAYPPTNAETLALFDDGQAAIIHRAIASGHAYLLGFDIGEQIMIGYGNREEGLARSYVNEYEPSIDVMLRMIRRIYEQGEPNAVILWTVPDGKSLSVIFTHDIDYARAWSNAVEFARMEAAKGIRVTNFVQTKYVRDWNDDVFFDQRGAEFARRLDSLGMEIGSHSVAHSRQYATVPIGTGLEEYPGYRPFVLNKKTTVNASVLGELRVSKFLLETEVTHRPLTSFRPGHLSNPYSLPEALEATGFKYSSSVTANNSLTHLPFRLTYDRSTAGESDIYEFPVTVEDEEAPTMDKRFDSGLALAHKIARYGGLFVLLIHPNVTAEKFAYERDLADSLKSYAWFGSVDQFGEWWAARDHVSVDAAPVDDSTTRLTIDPQMPIRSLAIQVPAGWTLTSVSGIDARQDGRLVEISAVSRRTTMIFRHP